MAQIPRNSPLHLLIPDVIPNDNQAIRSLDEQLAHNDEKEDYIKELRALVASLGLIPHIHRLTLVNHQAEILLIGKDEMVMNLCDGMDVDGVPGPSIALFLENNGYQRRIGCDHKFMLETLTKPGMKALFTQHAVSTPPGFGIDAQTPLNNLTAMINGLEMSYPLFVKVSDSYGSVGLDDQSVCHDLDQLEAKVQKLLLAFPALTIEEFIEGPEFSVLVSGNSRSIASTAAPVRVYPPAERRFGGSLNEFQKFVSFERNWDLSMLAHEYLAVSDRTDSEQLHYLAQRAYKSVSGISYGRVDIRKRTSTGKMYVLEVNASCGMGHGTSSEFILKLAGMTTEGFFAVLLKDSVGVVDLNGNGGMSKGVDKKGSVDKVVKSGSVDCNAVEKRVEMLM